MQRREMVNNPFLAGLTPEQYDLLSPLFQPANHAAGQAIFRQGDAATFMYLLTDGSVSILYKPYDGPQITLTSLHEGDVFGWSSVVGNPVYTSDALALNEVRTLRARGEDIRKTCLRHPTAGSQILQKLALAVAPRWVDAQAQVRKLLQEEILDGGPTPSTDALT